MAKCLQVQGIIDNPGPERSLALPVEELELQVEALKFRVIRVGVGVNVGN